MYDIVQKDKFDFEISKWMNFARNNLLDSCINFLCLIMYGFNSCEQ